MKDLNMKFIEEIGRIKRPEIFLGVARVLKVKLIEDTKDDQGHFNARSFEDICADTIEAFAHSDRRRKRELLSILRKANKAKDEKEGEVDADRTEDSEADIQD